MFETPRIVPHELVHTEAEPKTETREINCERYGSAYEPRSTMRVSQSAEICGDENEDGKTESYGSGSQGAGS